MCNYQKLLQRILNIYEIDYLYSTSQKEKINAIKSIDKIVNKSKFQKYIIRTIKTHQVDIEKIIYELSNGIKIQKTTFGKKNVSYYDTAYRINLQ